MRTDENSLDEETRKELLFVMGARIQDIREWKEERWRYFYFSVIAIFALTATTHVPDLPSGNLYRALAVASNAGARIAHLVAAYCTEGNCAPMGIETFDRKVIDQNTLICTPEVLLKAVENVNAAGAKVGPLGFPMLLPGLNLIYGLPGETHATHFENLKWLSHIMEAGLQTHRTNVRQVRSYPGTPLSHEPTRASPPSEQHFDTWKVDIDAIFDRPMKERAYPIGRRLDGLHSFFVTEDGTWHRRLGGYALQVVERGSQRPLYEPTSMTITDHAPRWVYGDRNVAGLASAAA